MVVSSESKSLNCFILARNMFHLEEMFILISGLDCLFRYLFYVSTTKIPMFYQGTKVLCCITMSKLQPEEVSTGLF